MSSEGPQPPSWVLFESDSSREYTPVPPSATDWKWKIVWQNAIAIPMMYLAGVYGAYLLVTKTMWATIVFAMFLFVITTLGITAGVHRLWAHKTYKARLPLRLILVFFNSIAFQGPLLNWARDHRMHHKYAETDADPHNSTRGFFYSHVGWLMVRKHPEVMAKVHTIDISDLWADPLLRFQKKYYSLLIPLACYVLPTYIPTLWGESVWNALFVCGFFRHIFLLNNTFLVNSAAHKWGYRPFDKNIKAVEIKFLRFILLGESFHNYHHTFPWDYKTGELGYYFSNLSKLFIDTMAKIGWAYDLKTVSADVIESRVKRTGDGSHQKWGSYLREKHNAVKMGIVTKLI